eukprot:19066-Heterococcus_DN1.PRE.1
MCDVNHSAKIYAALCYDTLLSVTTTASPLLLQLGAFFMGVIRKHIDELGPDWRPQRRRPPIDSPSSEPRLQLQSSQIVKAVVYKHTVKTSAVTAQVEACCVIVTALFQSPAPLPLPRPNDRRRPPAGVNVNNRDPGLPLQKPGDLRRPEHQRIVYVGNTNKSASSHSMSVCATCILLYPAVVVSKQRMHTQIRSFGSNSSTVLHFCGAVIHAATAAHLRCGQMTAHALIGAALVSLAAMVALHATRGNAALGTCLRQTLNVPAPTCDQPHTVVSAAHCFVIAQRCGQYDAVSLICWV